MFGIDYTFVATTPMPDSFSKSGYEKFERTPYVLKSYENIDNYKKALDLAVLSDIVVLGAASDTFIKERLDLNKTTFKYAERIFKKSKYQKFNPRAIWHQYNRHTVHRNKNCYMLCASAFTANDLKWLRAYPNKMFKWGYFTKVLEIPIQNILLNKRNKKFKILFVARLIKWKHPEMVVLVGKRLKELGHDFEINIIGNGIMENNIKNLVSNEKLNDEIKLHGNLSNDKVLELMQTSHAFFFSSDRNEGWGAVANEAMSNGCTLVASHTIGAVPYLVKPNVNGMVFESENTEDASRKLEKLIIDRDLCEKLALNAYKNLKNLWSPENAALSLIELYKQLKDCTIETTVSKGPCSKAFPTKNNWFK
tara:strand:+ start:502 stop:1596 length:1095 start_codon:yes stop_codon:yes gene_type:complete